MARLSKAAVAGIAIAAMLTVPAATASAKGDGFPPSTFIDIKDVDGYDFEVRNFGDDEIIYVRISKKDTQGSYSVEADEATTERMTADFPGYGQLSMEFKPKGEPIKTDLPNGCTGKRGEIQRGVWKGTFAFATTYAIAQVTKAPGKIVQSGQIDDCNGEPSRPPVSLSVFCSSPGESAFFSASQQNKNSQVNFSASQTIPASTPGGVSLNFQTYVRGAKNTFDYDLDATTATASPPKPFKRTGVLASDGTFAGDLEVKFIDGSARSFESGCEGQVGRFFGR